ncbi:MAG: porin [Chitinophagaceae bacterium]|nr:porin [Chitinophagaceae bacterium]
MKVVVKIVWLCVFFQFAFKADAQRYLTDLDTSIFNRDTVSRVVKRFENLYVSGYMQPQFQAAQRKGTPAYGGNSFQEFSDNRFMLRRARIKFDYVVPGKIGDFPAALFTFQFEATERDVNIRDVYVRVFEPKEKNLSLTAGLFSRPYGFEVNLSSSFRETPERGRMSQLLMPSERDLGIMATYESQNESRKNPQLKFDIGLFNGQGKSGPAEFDSYKDLISRLRLKPVDFGKNKDFSIGAGLSLLYGGWAQATKYKYEMGQQNGLFVFMVDSSLDNIGDKAPRQYYGADVQFIKTHGWGKTEIRGEYWRGIQPGTESTTENPGELPIEPTYIRHFDGAFFYFLQNIINDKWQLMLKYDWYDPNTDISKTDIGKTGSNLSLTDVRYDTYGMGFTRYFTNKLKVLVYYDIVRNEKTSLSGFTSDVKDNIFTCRVQMMF